MDGSFRSQLQPFEDVPAQEDADASPRNGDAARVHAGAALAQVKLSLQVFGQEHDEPADDDQLHAGAQTGDDVDLVGQQSPSGARNVLDVLAVSVALIGRRVVMVFRLDFGCDVFVVQGGLETPPLGLVHHVDGVQRLGAGFNAPGFGRMMVLFVDVHFDLLLLEFFREEKERNGDGDQRHPAQEEAAPPHAHPMPVPGVHHRVIRERVHVMAEKVSPEQEPADRSEGAHGVHDADVHGRVVPLDVVVDVGGAQGEQGASAAPQQQLGDHEDEDGHGRRLVGFLDAVLVVPFEVGVVTQARFVVGSCKNI